MITEQVDSKYQMAEIFCRQATCRDPWVASHLHLLQGIVPVASVGRASKHSNRKWVRGTAQKRTIQLPEPVDVVKQIHDARAAFADVAPCARSGIGDGQATHSSNITSLEVFVEGVAHHFNNLFMAIQGYASLLLREIDATHPGRVHLLRIEKLVHCESILTNDLLRLLIGLPYCISSRDQERLLKQIDQIACSFDATGGIRRASGGTCSLSNPPEHFLRSLSGSIACILGRLLSDIQRQTALFASEEETDDEALQRLQKIMALTRKGLQPVCQLLGYAGYTVQPNGHRIARSALIDALQKTAVFDKRRIRLLADVDADLPEIKLQHRQLAQILMEVLNNAAEAMTQGGDLFIEAAELQPEEIDEPGWNVPAQHYIRLTVRDSGHGFNPRFGRLVFEPFFTSKGREGHRGLGLPSIYGMLRTLGGYIGVDTQPGHGTTARIYLPSESARLPEKAAPARRGKRAGCDALVAMKNDGRPATGSRSDLINTG